METNLDLPSRRLADLPWLNALYVSVANVISKLDIAFIRGVFQVVVRWIADCARVHAGLYLSRQIHVIISEYYGCGFRLACFYRQTVLRSLLEETHHHHLHQQTSICLRQQIGQVTTLTRLDYLN
jgi:hypothetical protein